MFLLVEEQHSIVSPTSAIIIFSKAHGISCSHTKFQKVGTVICQIVHESTSGTGHTCLQQQLTGRHSKICQPVQKHCREKEKVENKNIGYCKAFYGTRKRKKTHIHFVSITFYSCFFIDGKFPRTFVTTAQFYQSCRQSFH